MTDDRLKNDVLRRADEDTSLSEDARLAILAALGDPDDLIHVLDDAPTSPQLVDSLTTRAEITHEPVGAYLRSISVQGFRGIGPKVTLPLPPGPGLIVIAGRNGSGKSTLAEALELALTGTNSRWEDRAVVWSKSWRNLHAGEPAEIRIGITEEGSGTTILGVDWPAGAEAVDESKVWVQRDGQKREHADVLGWDAALEMYRPLLSYDELGGILEGRPSDLYDELYKLLGLEQRTEAATRLDAEVKRLKEPAAELKKARDGLRPTLEDHNDPRAATAFAQMKKTKPDLDAVRPLITQGATSSIPFAWQQAQRLTVPTLEGVAPRCTALRSAAANEREETQLFAGRHQKGGGARAVPRSDRGGVVGLVRVKTAGAGESRAQIEDGWEYAATTRKRLALALDPNDSTAIEKWLAGGPARSVTMAVVTKGIHGGVHDYRATVKAARLATGDLSVITP